MGLGISGDDGMGIGDGSTDICLFQFGVVVHEFLEGGALAEEAEDHLNGDSHVPDDGLSVEDVGRAVILRSRSSFLMVM